MISFNEWCKKRTLMEAFDEPSAFGGLLYRWGKNAWAWKDGTKEPRVQDIHPSWYYNFRVNRLEGKQVIEVPVGVIHTEYELEWLKEPLADAQHAAQVSMCLCWTIRRSLFWLSQQKFGINGMLKQSLVQNGTRRTSKQSWRRRNH
jgi:hypothetical protein